MDVHVSASGASHRHIAVRRVPPTVFFALLCCLSQQALASAHIGPYDVPEEKFPSFAACRQSLYALRDESIAWERSRKASTDSSWDNFSYQSNGVIDSGWRKATYEDTRYYISVGKLADGTFISTGGSDSQDYACNGRVRSGHRSGVATPGEPSEYPAISRWDADRNAVRSLEPKDMAPLANAYTGSWKNSDCYPSKPGEATACRSLRLSLIQTGETVCGEVRNTGEAGDQISNDDVRLVAGTVVGKVAVLAIHGATHGSYLARTVAAGPTMGFRFVQAIDRPAGPAPAGDTISATLVRDEADEKTALTRIAALCKQNDG